MGLIKSDSAKKHLKLLQEYKGNNNVDEDSRKGMINSCSDTLNKICVELTGSIEPDDACENIMDAIAAYEPPAEEFEGKIEELNRLLPSVKKERNKIRIGLYSAKLLYIKGNKDSYFQFLAYKDSLHLLGNNLQEAQWICCIISSISRVIKYDLKKNLDDITDNIVLVMNRLFQEVQKAKVDYLNKKEYMQPEFERLYFSILDNIEALNKDRIICIGDYQPTKKEKAIDEAIDKLLLLLWNAAVQKKTLLDIYIQNKGLLSLHNEDLDNEYRMLLFQFYSNQNTGTPIKEKILKNTEKNIISSTNQHVIDNTVLLKNPVNRALQYLQMTKFNGEGKIIVLSFNPEGHDKNNKCKFGYKLIEKTQDIEKYVHGLKKYKTSIEQKGVRFDHGRSKYFNDLFISPIQNYNEDMLFKLKALGVGEIETDLTIYCDGVFREIPFEYFNIVENAPLGVKYGISYHIINEPPKKKLNFKKGILIVSDIPYQDDFKKYSALDTREEQQYIAALFNSKKFPVFPLYEKNANRKLFFSEVEKSKPAIIHIAAHGLYNEDLPFDASGILLSGTDQDEGSGILSFRDIVRMNLSEVELVVLSTCENSMIGNIQGNTVYGLAHAFILAGAKCVIGTRAKILNKHATIFIKKFYEYLMCSPVSEALRLTREYFYNSGYEDLIKTLPDKTDIKIKTEQSIKSVSDWILIS